MLPLLTSSSVVRQVDSPEQRSLFWSGCFSGTVNQEDASGHDGTKYYREGVLRVEDCCVEHGDLRRAMAREKASAAGNKRQGVQQALRGVFKTKRKT